MIPGRISVSSRALQRAVTAIAADELGVSAKDVGIQLSDDRGLLAISIVAPIRMRSLGRNDRARLDGSQTDGSQLGILRRCSAARNFIRDRTLALTGSEVRTVAVRVTRALILEESRVV